MATISKTKAAYSTLSTTTADTIKLLQWWDRIEVSNTASTAMYVTFDGTTPTAGADNVEIVEGNTSRVFPSQPRADGVPGSTSTPCHVVTVVANANTYGVIGQVGIASGVTR